MYAGNCFAGVGDIGIYGLITTTVANQQCKVYVGNGMNTAITFPTFAYHSFWYIMKSAHFKLISSV